jgi:hypothetical protein
MALVGVGIGTALMYWMDPTNGRRRRDRTRRSTQRAVRNIQRFANKTSRSLEKVSRMDLSDAAKMLVPAGAKVLLGR